MDILLRLRHLEGTIPPLDALQITPAQYAYIDKLRQVGPCSLQMLSQELELTPPTVSVMIKALERKGLVNRHRDNVDNRSFIFKLTRKGRNLYEQVDQFRKVRVANLLDRLEDQEQIQLLMLLDKATKKDQILER